MKRIHKHQMLMLALSGQLTACDLISSNNLSNSNSAASTLPAASMHALSSGLNISVSWEAAQWNATESEHPDLCVGPRPAAANTEEIAALCYTPDSGFVVKSNVDSPAALSFSEEPFKSGSKDPKASWTFMLIKNKNSSHFDAVEDTVRMDYTMDELLNRKAEQDALHQKSTVLIKN